MKSDISSRREESQRHLKNERKRERNGEGRVGTLGPNRKNEATFAAMATSSKETEEGNKDEGFL